MPVWWYAVVSQKAAILLEGISFSVQDWFDRVNCFGFANQIKLGLHKLPQFVAFSQVVMNYQVSVVPASDRVSLLKSILNFCHQYQESELIVPYSILVGLIYLGEGFFSYPLYSYVTSMLIYSQAIRPNAMQTLKYLI